LLNLPAITIRQTHERPEGMDVGTLVMSGLKAERILEAVEAVAEEHNNEVRTVADVSDYNSVNVSAQVYRIVLSYIDYVNRTVWKRQ
jgi:UDP-N-acetylglucosamine 2-epimerase (non-hydrolysing)